MVRGQYIAATGMIHQRRQMENVTNNITNADTSGYKKNFLVTHSFDEVLIQRINDPTDGVRRARVGPLSFGALTDQIYVEYTTGSFEETQISTDFALVGDSAFFAVETAQGERYCKSGAFIRNSAGYLTDGDGNYLLGNNGRIYVGNGDFAVDSLGSVSVGGTTTNRLRVVEFEDMLALRRQGDNLYYTTGAAAAPAREYRVMQGFLENSNVSVGREMVDMMTLYRAYEANQKMLTMIDETVGKAVNQIGRLR